MFNFRCPYCKEVMIDVAKQSVRGWTCPKCETILIPGHEAKKIRRMYERTTAKPLGEFGAACKDRILAERKRYLDPLTGVFSRPYVQDIIRACIEDGAARFALCLVDADNFKNINDTFGYAVGDKALVEIARALEGAVRDADTVARYGGEEFVIVFESSGDSASFVGERIVSSVRERKFEMDDQEVCPTVSAGVAIFPDHIVDRLDGVTDTEQALMELIRTANSALKIAKTTGKNKFVMFEESIPLIGNHEGAQAERS